MQWSRSETPLCSVNSTGEISENNPSDFHCEYKDKQLSIIFTNLQPLQTGDSQPYKCKVRSNKGAMHAHTTVELQGETLFNS